MPLRAVFITQRYCQNKPKTELIGAWLQFNTAFLNRQNGFRANQKTGIWATAKAYIEKHTCQGELISLKPSVTLKWQALTHLGTAAEIMVHCSYLSSVIQSAATIVCCANTSARVLKQRTFLPCESVWVWSQTAYLRVVFSRFTSQFISASGSENMSHAPIMFIRLACCRYRSAVPLVWIV